MLRRWLTHFPRTVLLLLLAPLLGAVIWQAVRFTPMYIIDLAFSADGRHLLVSSLKPKDPKEFIEASSLVQIWDLESGQLLDSRRIGQWKVLFTPYAENYIDISLAGQIRLLHPTTHELLKQWQLPKKFGKVFQVWSNGHLAIVASTTNGFDCYVTCLNSEGAHILAEAHSARFMISRNQSRLFVSFYLQAGTQVTDVYQIDHGSLRKLDKLSFSGRPSDIDSSGNVVYRSDSTGYSLLDLRTNKSRACRFPPGQIRPVAAFFTEQGRYFHAVFAEGLYATYDVTTGKIVSKRQLLSFSHNLIWPYAISRDQRMLAGKTDKRHVSVWDLTTGATVARFPDRHADRAGRFSFASCVVACSAWCVLWVVGGVHIKHTRPWLDMIVVVGLLLVVFTIHVATRPWEAIQPTVFASYLALLVALTAAICAWWVHGGQRWSLRLAGLLTGLAIVGAALLGTGHHYDGMIWQILLGAVGYLATLALLLRSWRWLGLTLTNAEVAATECEQQQGTRWQMPLIDLLFFTASIAVLLAVTRFVVTVPLGTGQVTFLAAFGVGLAITAFAAMWAALARRHWLMRLALLVFITALSGILPWFLTAILHSNPYPTYAFDWWAQIWWPEMVCGFTALAVLLSFSIFRLHGYYLSGRHLRVKA